MKLLTSFSILFFVLFSSCEKQPKTIDSKPIKQDTTQQNKNITKINVSLLPNTKKEIENWKEYKLVNVELTHYFAISNAEALSNAKELSSLVTHLKDSIRDERLKTPSIKARINVLHNECLRLNDMSSISAISQEEVTAEIKKILQAFSAFNAKLNSVFAVSELENELELDPDFENILKKTPEEDLIKTDESPKKIEKNNFNKSKQIFPKK